MIKILAIALFALLAGALAVHAMPPEAVPSATPVQPSFDIAMPAPQEPFDTSVNTAAETIGALRDE